MFNNYGLGITSAFCFSTKASGKGKPALVTKKIASLHWFQNKSVMEIDYDVKKWSYIARTTISKFKDKWKEIDLSLGYLIEGRRVCENTNTHLTYYCDQKTYRNRGLRVGRTNFRSG